MVLRNDSYITMPCSNSFHKAKLKRLSLCFITILPNIAYGLMQISCRVDTLRNTEVYSTVFFDNDDDLGWGDEMDVEDEFDVVYQGNALNSDTSQSGLSQMQMGEKGSEVNEDSMENLDDTDDLYYEKLFHEIEENPDSERQREHQEIGISENVQNKRAMEDTAEHKFQRRQSLVAEMRVEVKEYQQKSFRFRQSKRKEKREAMLQERASYLALRALRPKNSILDEIKHNEILPQPTLSLSSKRKYWRQEDLLQDPESIKLEQKLHGKRYKHAVGLYTRLLSALEEIQVQSREAAKDYISQQTEKDVEFLSSVKQVEDEVDVDNNKKEKKIDDIVKNNQRQQCRMTAIMTLSLYMESNNHSKLPLNFPLNVELKFLSTDDLRTVLRIRGNLNRRGRLPKTRHNILSHLRESLLRPLF